MPSAIPATVPTREGPEDWFARTRAQFGQLEGFLAAPATRELTHGALEDQLLVLHRALMRQALDDHFELRAQREATISAVTDAAGYRHGTLERNKARGLISVFGAQTFTRIAYRRREHANLCPADATANLPVEAHSHGIRRLAAIESARGSFADAATAIHRATGVRVGKLQVEALAQAATADFAAFNQARSGPEIPAGNTLVISADGKGIVMRPEARRSTEKNPERPGTKRMAEIGAVYTTIPTPRHRDDIIPTNPNRPITPGPTAAQKWLTASVEHDTASVIRDIFDEADRRDPHRQIVTVALVDGNRHQIDRINHEATTRGRDVTIIIDVIHVIEYLWTAARECYPTGDPRAKHWVNRHTATILDGDSHIVAGAIARKATRAGLRPDQRKAIDTCTTYLTNKRPYLNYPKALSAGWPIATGVIEGACRHLVADRLDITGARWGIQGAEAILKLRALIANRAFDEYWDYHLNQEHQRVHNSRYLNQTLPTAA